MAVNLFEKKIRLVDLTHTLHSDVPTWPGSCGFKERVEMDYEQGCRVLCYESSAGIGTHMDAPLHFIPGGADISTLPIDNFITPLLVLHLTEKSNPDYRVSVDDLQIYEKQYGRIPEHSFIAANTGWHKYWDAPSRYRNCDDNDQMHFPGYAPSAIELLLERNISGIGIDTLSPDGGDLEFPAHHLLLSAGKYIIENLTNLDHLTPSGGYVIALPPKFKNATEANLRVIALFPTE